MTNESGLEFENEKQNTLAEVFHPNMFIKDEMKARRWNFDELVYEASQEDPTTRSEVASALSLVVYKNNHVTEKAAAMLSRAFGTSPELWLNLQKAWDEQEARKTDAIILPSNVVMDIISELGDCDLCHKVLAAFRAQTK